MLRQAHLQGGHDRNAWHEQYIEGSMERKDKVRPEPEQPAGFMAALHQLNRLFNPAEVGCCDTRAQSQPNSASECCLPEPLRMPSCLNSTETSMESMLPLQTLLMGCVCCCRGAVHVKPLVRKSLSSSSQAWPCLS